MKRVIFFSGLDCSGKSTQIDVLSRKLEEANQRTLVFWSRGGYTNGFQFLKDILRKFSGKNLPEPGFTPQREKALANVYIRRIWLSLAMIDLFFYYVIYLRVKYWLGYIIICDRHLLDTNIDFKLTYPQNRTDEWVLWKSIKFLSLKPDLHFVSTVPVSESVIRSKFKFEPFPDSPEVLSERLNLYNKDLIENESLIFIDGLKNKKEITTEINDLVNQR